MGWTDGEAEPEGFVWPGVEGFRYRRWIFPCDLQEVNFHWAVTHRQPTCLGSDTLPALPHTPPWDLGASLKLLVLTNNSHYLLGLSVYVGYLPTQAPTLHPFDR